MVNMVNTDKIFYFCVFKRKPCEILGIFLRYYVNGSSLAKQYACMHTLAAWAVQKFVYSLLLDEVGNARVGDSAFHNICPKTPAVSNCFVLYLNAYNRKYKTIIQFIYMKYCIREKYLIKLIIHTMWI